MKDIQNKMCPKRAKELSPAPLIETATSIYPDSVIDTVKEVWEHMDFEPEEQCKQMVVSTMNWLVEKPEFWGCPGFILFLTELELSVLTEVERSGKGYRGRLIDGELLLETKKSEKWEPLGTMPQSLAQALGKGHLKNIYNQYEGAVEERLKSEEGGQAFSHLEWVSGAGE